MTCPRCNGPIIRNQDQHESYLSCLMCGYEPRITPLGEFYMRRPGNISKHDRSKKLP